MGFFLHMHAHPHTDVHAWTRPHAHATHTKWVCMKECVYEPALLLNGYGISILQENSSEVGLHRNVDALNANWTWQWKMAKMANLMLHRLYDENNTECQYLTYFNNSWFAIRGDGELLSTSYFCFLNYFYKELSFIKTFSKKHFVSFSPVSSSSSLPPLCPLSPVTSLLRSRDFRLPTFFTPIPLHLLASPIQFYFITSAHAQNTLCAYGQPSEVRSYVWSPCDWCLYEIQSPHLIHYCAAPSTVLEILFFFTTEWNPTVFLCDPLTIYQLVDIKAGPVSLLFQIQQQYMKLLCAVLSVPYHFPESIH